MRARFHYWFSISVALAFVARAGLAQELGYDFDDDKAVSHQTDVDETRATRPCRQGFQIAPYLFANDDQKIRVGWQYCDSIDPGFSNTTPAPVEVTEISADKVSSHTAKPRKSGKLWVADLPIAFCGDSSEKANYRVNGMAEPISITRVPCKNSNENAKFSLIADAQEGPEFVEMIAREIATFPGQAILSAGDLVQTGSNYNDWIDYFNSLSPVGGSRVTFSAIGNHEYRSDADTNYWEEFFLKKATNAYYSTWIGSVHLIVLNSGFEDDPTLIDSQIPFLKEELAKPAQWKIVMMHHPAYSQGVAQVKFAPKKEHLILRKLYVPLFELFNVDLVLAGHTHLYERSKKESVIYVNAGPAGGKMGLIATDNPYGVVVLRERTVTHFEVSSKELRMMTIDKVGHFVDSIRLKK